MDELRKELAAVKSEAEKKLVDLQMELKLVKQENSVIRKELLETLDKFSMQAEKLKRYEMSAGSCCRIHEADICRKQGGGVSRVTENCYAKLSCISVGNRVTV